MNWSMNNFCGGSPIDVVANSHPSKSVGATVTLEQSGGGLSFHHSMQPRQARELAEILLKAANEAERLESERVREVEHTA